MEIQTRSSDEIMAELKIAAGNFFTIAAGNATSLSAGVDSALEEASMFRENLKDDAKLAAWYDVNKCSKGDAAIESVYYLVGEYLLSKGLIGQVIQLRDRPRRGSIEATFTHPEGFYRLYKNTDKPLPERGTPEGERFFVMAMIGMIIEGKISKVETIDLELLMEQKDLLESFQEWNPVLAGQVQSYLALSGFTEEL